MAGKCHYVVRIGDQLCEFIAMGRTLEQALKEIGYLAPTMQRFWRWMEEIPEFRAKYERARMLQADVLADKRLEMAAEVLKKPNAAAAYRVAADILASLSAVRDPGKYGAKVTHDIKAPLDPAKMKEEIARLEEDLGVGLQATPGNVVNIVGRQEPPEETARKELALANRRAAIKRAQAARKIQLQERADALASVIPPFPSQGGGGGCG